MMLRMTLQQKQEFDARMQKMREQGRIRTHICKDDKSDIQPTKAARPRKFGNKPKERDGIKFSSRREANRYDDLMLLVSAKAITDLKLQVRYPLEVNGMLVCEYVADFTYTNGDQFFVEDAKGFRTPEYILKKKLMRAIHGIEILET